MSQKNQYNQVEVLLQANIPIDSDDNQKDFLNTCQTSISTIEIGSSIFYVIQKVELLIITIISSLSIFSNKENANSTYMKINKFTTLLCLSPKIFKNISFKHYLASIGIILFLLIAMMIFTLLIGSKIQNESKINHTIIKMWMILTHLFLPIPGYIIGFYFAHYFYELTHEIRLVQLMLIVFTGIIWCWEIITCNVIYNSNSFKRKSDVNQVNHDFISLHIFLLIFPMIQQVMAGIIKTFFPSCDLYIYSSLLSLVSIFTSLYITHKKPYESDTMNRYAKFLFLIQIPLIASTIIAKHFPTHIENYLMFLVVFLLISFSATFKPFSSTSETSASSSGSAQDPNQTTGSKTHHIYDPTINLPFPFNRASFTKQDITLYIFVFSSVIFMNILNALAAQRIPAANRPLSDFIHDRFMVSKCLRTNITKAISQISNDFILFQIFLLFFILFVFPKYLDFRRAVLIFGCICIIRAIAFIVTSLPIPCAGEPNCPCADLANIRALKDGNAFRIAMSWLFGLGMFLKYPQCGDLIISGHTISIWLFTRTICAALGEALQRPFNWLVMGFLYTFSFFTMMYIVMSKNHYSIDVWFGFIITELFWSHYNALLKLSMLPPKPSDSFCVKLVRWIEKRPSKRALIVNQKMKEELLKN